MAWAMAAMSFSATIKWRGISSFKMQKNPSHLFSSALLKAVTSTTNHAFHGRAYQPHLLIINGHAHQLARKVL